MKKVVIVGGGISGLFSAYYLNKQGYKITIIDNTSFSRGCSHGNAGLVVPSHIIPLAAPGVIPKALKWMFNSNSPFSIHPRLNKDFLSWCFKFASNSTKSHVEHSIEPLRDISLLSSRLYHEVAHEFNNSFSLNSRGLLMLYKNERTAEEEEKIAELAIQYGITANVLNAKEIQLLDPNCKYDVLGGVHYKSDSHLVPHLLMNNLLTYLKSENVELISDEHIESIQLGGKSIKSVSSSKRKFESDFFLFSSGVWTQGMLKKIKFNLPLMPGKGYSFDASIENDSPSIPSILVDDRVAVTPMNNFLRVAGTMEIDVINSNINTNRVKGMFESFKKYYPNTKIKFPKKNKIWYGLRPCSPDGLPYIGKSNEYSNLFIAAGHAMLGLSLGPATGKLISEIISNTKTSVQVSPFNPNRYN